MTALFTRADYKLLPEGFPAQLIEGRLVKEPAPTYGHRRLQTRVLQGLLAWVPPDLALCAPVDVVIDELNVFQPDVVVLRRPGQPEKSGVGIPLLAVEVLSPSTREQDRRGKRNRLLAAGVREVWLVEPALRSIECWTPDGCAEASAEGRVSSRALAGFSQAPDELFAPPQ